MKALIQRKTILLSLLILLGLLAMSCFFLQSKPEELPVSPTIASTVTFTSLPSQSETTSTLISSSTPFPTSTLSLTSTPTLTVTPTASSTAVPTKGYPPDPPPLPAFDESRLGEMDENTVYCVADDGTELKMHVYYPEKETGPWPVMLYVHGGGWTGGTKGSQWFFPEFTELGLLGVTIDYRLSPGVQFPAHIEDVKCAVRHLRANAEHYNLDPDRILAMGGSAGGHLVSLLGTTGDSGEFNVGQYMDESSAVQAVIALSAPTDLVNWGCNNPDRVENYYSEVFGSNVQCGEYDQLLADASPMTYISEMDVPFLFVAGLEDEIVPYQQSETMYIALLNVGVSSQLLLVEGADHNLNVPDHPEKEEKMMQMIIEFIVEQLDLPDR